MTTGTWMIQSPLKSRKESVLVILGCLCLREALGYLEQLSVQEQGVGSLGEVLTVGVQVPELVQIPGQSKAKQILAVKDSCLQGSCRGAEAGSGTWPT